MIWGITDSGAALNSGSAIFIFGIVKRYPQFVVDIFASKDDEYAPILLSGVVSGDERKRIVTELPAVVVFKTPYLYLTRNGSTVLPPSPSPWEAMFPSTSSSVSRSSRPSVPPSPSSTIPSRANISRNPSLSLTRHPSAALRNHRLIQIQMTPHRRLSSIYATSTLALSNTSPKRS